jgi:hypothetical protein
MSVSRVVGLIVVSAWLATACSGSKKIDVGGTCILNSDCNQGLVCTWGKCHAACHTSADCPAGEACVTSSDQSMVCQLPGETYCIYNHDCPAGLICGVDQKCRKQCQVDVDCPYGQICTSDQTCVDPNQVGSNTAPDGGVSDSDGAFGAGGTAGSSDASLGLPADAPASAGGTGGAAYGSGGTSSGGGVTTSGGTTTQVGGNTTVPPPTTGHYLMENLDRGAVAVKISGGVYVGWRMLGYEYTGTDSDTSYNLYRDGTLLKNVTDSANYLDAAGTSTSKYTVSAVLKGKEGAQSAPVTVWSQNYLSIPTTPPVSGTVGVTYSANDGSPGDLDGDGKLDIVLKWDPSNSQDNTVTGTTDNVYLDGYTLAGQQLWRIDLGANIRAGAHYTQFSVYDFDGDGKAEVACKTAPGTKDGLGNYLGTGPAAGADNSQIYRNTSGYILTGPEWITVFNGATGKELATINYPVLRGNVSDWGDAYGNLVDRFNGGVAFVKDFPTGGGVGVANGLPSIISGRGYSTRMTISALTFRNGVLAKNWIYDSQTALDANGSGNPWEAAADVDGDGAQEIITGPSTISSDGKLMCDTGLGLGDAMDVGQLIPGKGIAVFSTHDALGGQDAHDAATCGLYFNITNPGQATTGGRAEYVGVGDETSASCSGFNQVLCTTGAASGPSAGSNFVIYWDADEWRELEDATSITKAGGATLLTCTQCASNNGTKATPTLTADLLGDWREEIIWRESGNSALRVYTTTDVTKRRLYTLMHDPTYRAQVSFEQSAYNQPPHTGFRISPNMAPPPVPNIFIAK